MKTMLLAAGAAAVALSAGTALAAPSGKAVAGPKQPIPFSQLNAYLKASPKVRASKDWWSGQQAGADTGSAANTGARAPVTPSLPGDTAVNPPQSSATPAPALPAAAPIPPSTPAPGAPAPDPATPPK